jgi:hypothetical protein
MIAVNHVGTKADRIAANEADPLGFGSNVSHHVLSFSDGLLTFGLSSQAPTVPFATASTSAALKTCCTSIFLQQITVLVSECTEQKCRGAYGRCVSCDCASQKESLETTDSNTRHTGLVYWSGVDGKSVKDSSGKMTEKLLTFVLLNCCNNVDWSTRAASQRM